MGCLGLLKHYIVRRHAGYLCEDLANGLEKLLASGELDEYQTEQAIKALEMVKEVSGLDIGANFYFGGMQFVLSEISLELYEGDETNLKVQKMINDIQEHLDSL